MTPPTASARAAAPAKINLFLRVTGKREDGYHLLDSLAVFAGVGDVIRASPAAGLSLSLGGSFSAALAVEPDNLVLRAARALATAHRISAGARLELEKNLPIASGIGGGSADAAATLRALSRLWDITPPAGSLADLALTLGADVPVCLDSAPRLMGGVGEILAPAPSLPSYGLLLVNAGAPVSTPAVFKARAGGFSAPSALPAGWASAAAMAADLATLGNDLQAAAVGLCPVVGDVLDRIATLPGCLLAQMSGSGGTCFGIFATPLAAQEAAAAAARPGWWIWGGAPWGFTSEAFAP